MLYIGLGFFWSPRLILCEILQGRDLSPVTDALWKQFYKKDFGEKSFNTVVERMKEKKVRFGWKQLYEVISCSIKMENVKCK